MDMILQNPAIANLPVAELESALSAFTVPLPLKLRVAFTYLLRPQSAGRGDGARVAQNPAP